MSLEEARRTIHQYKNRRRQHHHHHHQNRLSDLTIKCEPSFCSSSESNINLSPISLSVGEGIVDLPVSSTSSSSSSSSTSSSSSSTSKQILHKNDEEVKIDYTINNNHHHQDNKFPLSFECSPLNLTTNNSNLIKMTKSLKCHRNKSKSSILHRNNRLFIKFGCKFCSIKLNSWKSIIFHVYMKHCQQLTVSLTTCINNNNNNSNSNEYPLKYFPVRLRFINESTNHNQIDLKPLKFLKHHFNNLNQPMNFINKNKLKYSNEVR